MRDFVIILVILAIILVGGFFVEKKLKSTEENLISQLDILHGEIENANMNNLSGIETFEKSWNESKIILNILANHQRIDEIDIQVYQMIKNYESQNSTETFLNLIAIKTMIGDIHRGESFTLANIL